MRKSLELCDPLDIRNDSLLPGDRGGQLFHVVTTMFERKSGWLLEVANIEKYADDAKNRHE